MSDLIHGVEVLEITSGSRPVKTVRTSVIGLVGTAGMGPVNTPVLITGPRQPQEIFGTGGTIAESLSAIYKQAGALVVAVNVLDPAAVGHVAQVADEALGAPAQGGKVALAKPWVTAITSLVRDPEDAATVLVEGTDFTLAVDPVTGLTTLTILADLSGDELEATYSYADFAAITPDDIAGQALPATGVYALIGAESVTGARPGIIIAPGKHFETDLSATTAIPAALGVVANRIKAVGLLDSPNTTMAAAITAEALIASARSRLFLVDPWVKVDSATVRAPSPFVAGLIAQVDNEEGYWVSPSNHTISGIVGTSRPVDFALGDPACEADVLNGAHIATIINMDGFRLWGNRTLEKTDTRWRYLCVRRTADVINRSLLTSHLWAVDRGITKTYDEDVLEAVRAFLRHLVAQGAILGGAAWVDPELNTAETVQLGQRYFDFDFTPTYPAEKVTFRSQLVNDYIEEALAS